MLLEQDTDVPTLYEQRQALRQATRQWSGVYFSFSWTVLFLPVSYRCFVIPKPIKMIGIAMPTMMF